jgi:hypothetical protein
MKKGITRALGKERRVFIAVVFIESIIFKMISADDYPNFLARDG